MALNDVLVELRKKRGMTQLDVATKLGIPRGTYSNYETGLREPDLETVWRLAQLFEVSTDILYSNVKGVKDKSQTPSDRSPIEMSKVSDNMGSTDETVSNVAQLIAPIVAEIACGDPLYTEDSILGYFAVNPIFANINDGPYVWVKAKGESMINVRIFDGSLVLLRIQSTVDSGDIAAVCVDEETATLKRVYFLADGIMLSPENPNMTPTTYSPERIRIVGKAISVVSEL